MNNNNKLAFLHSITNSGDFPPTASSQAVKTKIVTKANEQIVRWQDIMNKDLQAFKAERRWKM